MDDFTLLMAVYAQDDEAFVRSAYLSATRDQELPPTCSVIVQDGPVSAGVARWLSEVSEEPGVTVVHLEKNMGLGAAINRGLRHVETEIVARVDADDICLPNRFSTQIPLIETGLDVVGSSIAEFTMEPPQPGVRRLIHTTQAQIMRHARLECPFHHPTVVFRKQAVLGVGGYPPLPQMEDYLLWAKMLIAGARVANVPEVLVYYRVGAGAFRRRGGKTLAVSEAKLQKEFLSMGFIDRWEYSRNRLLRGVLYRHLPTPIRRFTYHMWKRATTHHLSS